MVTYVIGIVIVLICISIIGKLQCNIAL